MPEKSDAELQDEANAYFAELNASNVVLRVIAVDWRDCPNEAAGRTFCTNLLGGVRWIQTWQNANGLRSKRLIFASPNFTYNATADIFITYQPYAGWIYNSTDLIWEAPVAKPTSPSDAIWSWQDASQSWINMNDEG